MPREQLHEPSPASKEMISEILSDAHAIHCAAEVGMPCDCRVPGAIAAMRAEIERLRQQRDELRAALRNALPVLEFEVETRGSNDLLYEIPAGPVLDATRAAIAKAEGRSDE